MTCASITISAEGISQETGAAGTVTIGREAIRSLQLSHAGRSRRPFFRFFAGFLLMAIGTIFLIAAFLMAEGGVVEMHFMALSFSVPVVPLVLWAMVGAGLWLVMGVFRGCYGITVRSDSGTRTFSFPESMALSEILRFIARANRDLGYAIDTSLTASLYLGETPEDGAAPRQ